MTNSGNVVRNLCANQQFIRIEIYLVFTIKDIFRITFSKDYKHLENIFMIIYHASKCSPLQSMKIYQIFSAWQGCVEYRSTYRNSMECSLYDTHDWPTGLINKINLIALFSIGSIIFSSHLLLVGLSFSNHEIQ